MPRDRERLRAPIAGFSLNAKRKSPLRPLFSGARRFSCLKNWGTSKTHQRLYGISIDRKTSLTLQHNNLQHLPEYMTQDQTSLFNIKQLLKRRTFFHALQGHYSARYKCADIVGQKIGASSQTDTSKCIIRHLRMVTRFQNTLAVFASEDSTISSVLRMHLNCLKH